MAHLVPGLCETRWPRFTTFKMCICSARDISWVIPPPHLNTMLSLVHQLWCILYLSFVRFVDFWLFYLRAGPQVSHKMCNFFIYFGPLDSHTLKLWRVWDRQTDRQGACQCGLVEKVREIRVIKVIKHAFLNVFPSLMPPFNSLLKAVLALCESVCQSVCSSELVKMDGGVMLIPICCNHCAYYI